jgi:hypothetical protein
MVSVLESAASSQTTRPGKSCGENDDAYLEVLKDIVLEKENSVGGYTGDGQC